MLIIFTLLTIIVLGCSLGLEVLFFLNKTVMDLYILLIKNNLLFILGIVLISSIVFLWGLYYIMRREKSAIFFIALFLFVVSIILLVLRDTLFIIFLGWEGLGLTSFLLIIFYQNWISFRGGLLTLLTNRLGDAVLMISYRYWIIIGASIIRFFLGGLGIILFSFLTITKSAQVPFTRWLPAAIAAPTPVRALVHRSTLVTAGIWLLIQFGVMTLTNRSFWLFVGVITLVIARLTALIENDAKKVVALSTLSQLGLMYVALFLGGSFITLFHLLMHALAKANLFLIIGNMLHSRFSQQDIRFMSSGLESPVLLLITFVSLLRLVGIVFTSGFLSKDLILLRHYFLLNSLVSWLLVLSIITLTTVYCFKLFLKLVLQNNTYSYMPISSIFSQLPSLVLRLLSLVLGWVFVNNIILFKIVLSSRGVYWMFIILVFILLANRKVLTVFFKRQLNIIDILNRLTLKIRKKGSLLIRRTLIESTFLRRSLFSVSVLLISSRLIVLLTITILFLLLV